MRRKQVAEQEADQPRDDTGEPVEQKGQGSRRPLGEQILEEQRQEGQPRNAETGQFESTNDPLQRFGGSPTTHEAQEPTPFTPEEPAAAEPEEPAQEEPLLAGRFRDPAELERAYVELEQMEGRRSGELGDLRARVDDLSRRLVTPDAPQPQMQPPLSEDQVDRGLSEHGVEFIAQLYENEHPSYDAALDRLFDVAPRMASEWQSRVAAWEAQRELRAELGPALSAVATPVQRNESQSRWNAAWQKTAAQNPEMNQLSGKMLEDLQANPYLTLPIKEGLPGAEEIVIENLLVRSRDANRDKLLEARTEVDNEIDREKVDATVVSAGSGAARVADGGIEEGVLKLKRSILNNTQGQNVHDAIHGAQG